VPVIDILDILGLLDGTYVEIKSSLAITLFTSSEEMFIAFCFAFPTMQAVHTPRVPRFNSQFNALQVAQHIFSFMWPSNLLAFLIDNF
jgi:hypothetical protein